MGARCKAFAGDSVHNEKVRIFRCGPNRFHLMRFTYDFN